MRRVLDDPVAIYTWLLVTLAGVVAMLVVGQSVLFIIGFVLGGGAAFALVDLMAPRSRR